MLITLEFDEKETRLLKHLLSGPAVPFRGQGLGDLDVWVGPWVVHQLATSAGEG